MNTYDYCRTSIVKILLAADNVIRFIIDGIEIECREVEAGWLVKHNVAPENIHKKFDSFLLTLDWQNEFNQEAVERAKKWCVEIKAIGGRQSSIFGNYLWDEKREVYKQQRALIIKMAYLALLDKGILKLGPEFYDNGKG